MASMVAKACSSTSTEISAAMMLQEKGSRNKRKFRADPPMADPSKIIPLPENEYEFTAEKFDIMPSHGHSDGCDICSIKPDSSEALKLELGLSCAVASPEVGTSQPREQNESTEEFHDADWSDLTESQLEELVLNNLDAIFKSAIKKIIAFGYSEEVATKAVLRSGLCYGCKDTVSNIVDNTLAFLRSGQEMDPSRDHYFEDLQQMEKYILAELVCVLREVRPFFSTGDAMWCLLICDMNVSHACAMDSDFSNLALDATPNGNSSVPLQPQLPVETKNPEPSISPPFKPNSSVSCAHTCPAETRNISSLPCGHTFQAEASCITGVSNSKPNSSSVQEKKWSNSTSHAIDKPFSTEEKFVGSKRVSGIAKREYILRQKSLHLEKHYRSYGSKGGSRAGKLTSFGGLVLDKKLKSVTESTGLNVKNASFKISKAMGVDVPQENINHSTPANTEFSSVSEFGVESANINKSYNPSLPVVNPSPPLPVADTELSLSFPAKGIPAPVPIRFIPDGANFSYSGMPNDKSLAQWVPQDRKDEMIMKLVPRARELQNQLQEWTEWANQKVMQAARRLGKDKAELKTLRQEKEEVERLKKEKQTLEENTMKKLSEMDNALGKASGQVDRANAAVRRLEVENAALRREMEIAKLRAAESAASCQEVSKREKKTLMKVQSWEKQKTILQEELLAEKRTIDQMQQKLEHAKNRKDQLEAKWKQEEAAKEEFLAQARTLRKEREQIETNTKVKMDMIKSKAETNLQKYKDDIAKLEKKISQLRLKTDSSKIAALRRGIDGSYVSKVTDLKNSPPPRESRASHVSKVVAGFQESSGSSGGVKRERECVMCLSEEMTVVFLPCAHQVVCTTCNELHEKQGMKDCPSCRSTIQRRINVRFARS